MWVEYEGAKVRHQELVAIAERERFARIGQVQRSGRGLRGLLGGSLGGPLGRLVGRRNGKVTCLRAAAGECG